MSIWEGGGVSGLSPPCHCEERSDVSIGLLLRDGDFDGETSVITSKTVKSLDYMTEMW